MNPRPEDGALMACYPADYSPHTSRAPAQQTPTSEAVPQRRPSLSRRILRTVPFARRFLCWLGQQNATVMPEIPALVDDPQLLEVGCAYGYWLQEAHKAGWNVTGIEPSPAAAERAREHGFTIKQDTLTTADLAEESFDAVVAWMVLEHVPNPKQFVERAWEILKANGAICVSIPSGGGFERRLFGRYWLGYDAPRHLQIFTPGGVRAMFHQAGFDEIEIVHQSNLRYWWGSIAAWGADRFPASNWPVRWMEYFRTDLPLWMTIMSLVPEKLLSLMRLSGRITVIAKKQPRD